MRAIVLVVIFACGCKHADAIAVAALGAVAVIAEVASEAERQRQLEEYERRIEAHHRRIAVENAARDLARSCAGVEYLCPTGRSYHLRCFEAPRGFTCMYESDDGRPFLCPDGDCRVLPAALEKWCRPN